MNQNELHSALKAAAQAARAAGALMRRNLRCAKVIKESFRHDLKLELDVRCQKLIERQLQRALPSSSILGEEGIAGDAASPCRWVIDPIDGTVNFAYGIPHACVSIALQASGDSPTTPGHHYADGYRTLLGVIYDPFTDELWSAIRGQPAYLNGRRVQASPRQKLNEAVIALGFSKSKFVLEETLPQMASLVHRVRKIRIMGSAALSLAYVAGGRMDAYLENGVRLWDIAAGGLIIECAGGEFECREVEGDQRFWMLGSNGVVGRKMLQAIRRG